MSKNQQRNLAEINLGNETYDRGYYDGLNGAAKNIKKTHRHAHRYHIGHRKGSAERARFAAVASPPVKTNAVIEALKAQHEPAKQATFWNRLKAWLCG